MTAATPRRYGNLLRVRGFALGRIGLVPMVGFGLTLLLASVLSSLTNLLITAVVTVTLLVMLGVLGVADHNGRTLGGRLFVRVVHARSVRTGENLYQSGPLTELGTARLPGMLADTTLTEWTDAAGQPFALLHIPATKQAAVVIATNPDGASLRDDEIESIRVDAFAEQWLAGLGDYPSIEQSSITIESARDTGANMAREVARLGDGVDHDPDAFETRVMTSVVKEGRALSDQIRVWSALTFKMATVKGKADLAATAAQIAVDLPGLLSSLSGTGAGPCRAMVGQDLCDIVADANDPERRDILAAAQIAGAPPMTNRWDAVGPLRTQNERDRYYHDSACSMSWVVQHAPPGQVGSNVFNRLHGPNDLIPIKRVTWLYKHLSPAAAKAAAEADIVRSKFRNSGDQFGENNLTDKADITKAMQNAADHAAGAGMVQIAGIITGTVLDPEKLPQMVSAMNNARATARIEIRPTHGMHDAAFQIALGIGLDPARHAMVPQAIRSNVS